MDKKVDEILNKLQENRNRKEHFFTVKDHKRKVNSIISKVWFKKLSDILEYEVKNTTCKEKDERKYKECMKYKAKYESILEGLLYNTSKMLRKYYV